MRSNFKKNYNLFIRQSGLAAAILDSDMKIIECNEQFLELAGRSETGIKNCLWNDIISYDYPYTPLENGDIYGKTGIVPSGKFWCSIKNKIPRKIVSATLSYESSSGMYYATLYDITDQLRPERLIHDGGLLIGSIADNLKGAMGFHDREGIIRFASREICNMLGIDKSRILGRSIKDFFEEDDVNEWLYWFRERTDELPKYLEFDSLKRNGRVFHAIATPKIFYDMNRKVAGCMFIFSDITEFKIAEQKLRVSDEKYSKAFYASPAPSSITTLNEGRYVDINESYLKLVGYTKDELIGKTTTEIDFFTDAEDREKFVSELMEEGKLRDYETQMFSRVKGIRRFSLSAEIIELQGEKCIIWAGYDVTDQIRLEKEVLTVTGRERYRIGQYLHDDLAQHIVGIDAMCSLLKNRLRQQLNSEFTLAEQIQSYVKEAHEKTRALSRGLCPLRMEENGLSSGISELASSIEKMYGIVCEFRNNNRDVMIYNSQIAINMYYIVQEAITNAIKHGKCDTIIITYSSNEENIYLCIEDNGIGFSVPASEPKGIGLEIMKYRARAIGGSLEIGKSSYGGIYVLIKFPKVSNQKIEWDWKAKSYEEITDTHS
ncbi:MAG TPA: PAS domain S-box protein [Spirochaetota bacterium]|nr:PAS domain S-box protein [Spirochaetota bacterium]